MNLLREPISSNAPAESTMIQGDALTALCHLPEEFFQCCITSPPYWGLRDYRISGQIGLEEDPYTYVEKLAAVFGQVKRVLKENGVLWLNAGDSYTSGNRGYRAPDKKNPVRAMSFRAPTPKGLKPKDLIGIPWRLAFALQEAGWYLRADIIWEKPNCMPESVKDRPTRSHEYLFLLSKSERYFYDGVPIRGRNSRNPRTVWVVPTEPLKDAHFASFPPKLIEPCILSSSRPGDWILDPFFGSGTVGVVAEHQERNFVGIELNPSYVKIAERRIRAAEKPLFNFDKSKENSRNAAL